MKKGVMMRAGYDKGSGYPFSQTPPEDARSGEWTEKKGREKVAVIKKQGKLFSKQQNMKEYVYLPLSLSNLI